MSISSLPNTPAMPNRIASMDQFRGYTVAGMFLVNFLGGMKFIHSVLHHNDTYFSYADTIMPSFIFAVGFSYRLTILRRLPKFGALKTYFTYIRRSIALIVVSLLIFGFGSGFKNWDDFNNNNRNYYGPELFEKADPDAEKLKAAANTLKVSRAEEPWTSVDVPERLGQNWKIWALKLLKSDLWEVLSIIAFCQLFIMPVVAARWWVRLLAMVGCGVGHALMTHYFNWDFENGLGSLFSVGEGAAAQFYMGVDQVFNALKDSGVTQEALREMAAGATMTTADGQVIELVREGDWMDKIWGIRGVRSWDGGFFGIVSWSFAMLAGTLVYDLMSHSLPGRAGRQLLIYGSMMMVLGYGMSCVSRLYDLEPIPGAEEIAKLKEDLKNKTDTLRAEKTTEFEQSEGNSVDERVAIATAFTAAVAEATKETNEAIAKIREENTEAAEAARKYNKENLYDRRGAKYAASPVVPDFYRAKGRDWKTLLTEPPFVAAPSTNFNDLEDGTPVRVWNYWMMGKRTVNQSFMMFSTGFAIFLYGLFVFACDIGRLRVGVFRTFGMNPLAAYAIHEISMHTMLPLLPKDAQVWFVAASFVVWFTITYLCIRGLEKQEIYVRM